MQYNGIGEISMAMAFVKIAYQLISSKRMWLAMAYQRSNGENIKSWRIQLGAEIAGWRGWLKAKLRNLRENG